MKHLLVTATLALAFFGLTQDSQANGGLFRRCRGGCDTGCESAPCASTVVAAPAPQFEDRKVTRYKQVMKEKEVDVLECKRVTREEKYTYTVCVPVTKEEKRKVIVCTPVHKEVDYVYTVMVPKTVQKKVQCTNWVCERVNVIEKVPVCRTVCVTYVDECGRCCTRRERVTELVEVTRCVVKRTPVVTEQVVNVVVCEAVQKQGKRTVCEIVRAEKEELVKVCSFEHVKKEGTRLVCEVVTEKVKRKVQYCELVAYEETVRVQVGGCATSCDDGCGHGHGRRGGFFRRGGCCN